jgi:hypothetical protein
MSKQCKLCVDNICTSGHYPYREVPPFCRGGVLVPKMVNCMKETIPLVNDGKGGSIQIKAGKQ